MSEQLAKPVVLDRALRLVSALILGMAIPPKFAAAPGAVAIFTQLGVEPFGRLATGGFEALAVVLLLAPPTVVFGALLAAGLMTGAILSHLLVLGVAPGGDPSMFLMALATFVSSVALAWRRRAEIPVIGGALGPDPAPRSSSAPRRG